MVKFGNDWDYILANELQKSYYLELREFLKREYTEQTVFPPAEDIFNAFRATSFDATRIVILGQDPYHGTGQAHGMCFSVRRGVAVPASLRNIYKEIETELCGCSESQYSGAARERDGNLEHWAAQGVLLLNAVLTVRKGSPGSHAGKGWETFTDNVISLLSARQKPLIFMLWGNYARKKAQLIDRTKHSIMEAAHPSPFSASAFFACGHFKRANEILVSRGEAPIKW